MRSDRATLRLRCSLHLLARGKPPVSIPCEDLLCNGLSAVCRACGSPSTVRVGKSSGEKVASSYARQAKREVSPLMGDIMPPEDLVTSRQ